MEPVSSNKVGDQSARTANFTQRLTSNKPVETVRKTSKKRRITKSIVALVVVILLSVGAWLVVNQPKQLGVIDKGSYQAVFLTNGQVYFGKLQNTGGDYIELTSIYYLQTPQAVQQSSTSKTATTDQTQTQLVKLGNELHGPQDDMQISSNLCLAGLKLVLLSLVLSQFSL